MKYLIVGGNAAGMSAASRLRRNLPDARITVLEKGNLVSFGGCGLPYYVGGEFDDSNRMIARPLEAFQKSNIDVKLFREAVSLDVNTKTVKVLNMEISEEETYSYDKLLISTGAYPFIPPVEGVNLQNVFTLTKMKDGVALRKALVDAKNIVVVGGGFIGLESAEAFLHQGKNVTVIEMDDRVSSRVFDREITSLLEENLKKHGVILKTSEKLTALQGSLKVQKLITDKGSYDADLVLIAAGFVPSTAWCKNSGLEMLSNGALIIDQQCRTNIWDIYSAGDCASVFHAVTQKQHYIPLATTANKLGRLLGDVMAGKDVSFQGALGSSALRFMDFEVSRTGLSAWEAEKYGFDAVEHFVSDMNHTNYVPGQAPIHIKLIYDRKTRVILGGQICGASGAALRGDILALAVFKKMTVDELGMMDFLYAPPFARTWEALNIAGNTAK